jgi:O-antigen ligase
MKDPYPQVGLADRRLVLQVLGFILLTGLLFQILSGSRGLMFLQAVLGGVCALCLFKEPHWGVVTILTMWFIEFSPSFLGIRYLGVPYVISAVLLVPLALALWRDREVWVLRVPQIKIFLAITIIFIVSSSWNYYKHPIALIPELDNTVTTMQILIARLIFLIFFLYFITTRQRIESVIWIVILLIIASALSAFYNLFLPGAGRAWASFGLGKNANRLAFICLFGASLLWFYRTYALSERWKKLSLLLFLPLPVIALASGSRAGFLQTIILVAIILKEQEGWSITKRVRSFFLLGAVSLLFLTIVPTASFLRATTFEASATAPGGVSTSHRIDTVYAALEMFAQDPILGIGPGNFRWMHQAFYGSDLVTHNSYVWALVSGGIGALVLYLVLFYMTYRTLRQLERSGPRELLWVNKGLRINLILFMIASAFADLWHIEFIYLMVGLTVAVTRLQASQVLEPARVSSPFYRPIVQKLG